MTTREYEDKVYQSLKNLASDLRTVASQAENICFDKSYFNAVHNVTELVHELQQLIVRNDIHEIIRNASIVDSMKSSDSWKRHYEGILKRQSTFLWKQRKLVSDMTRRIFGRCA